MRKCPAAGIPRFECLALVCLLLCLGIDRAKAGTDFLIIENVDRLQIYNKYQQVATAQDRELFARFAPMRILKASDVLGDGFTRCMQVEVGGQIFFLLKDADNHLGRSGSLGYERMFSNTIILLDTVQILTGHSVRVSPENSQAEYLSPGALALRIFQHGKLTYCQTLTGARLYGWADFKGNENHRTWQVVDRITQKRVSLSPPTIHKIEMQIAEVNRVLTKLYGFFNRQTHQNKPPPQWSVDASNDRILCTLQGEPNGEAFKQSTFYLVNEIENVVLGSDLHVTHTPGSIEIRNR